MKNIMVDRFYTKPSIVKWVLPFLLLLFGSSLVAVQQLDYTSIKLWLDSMAVDGSSDLFSSSLFEMSTRRLRLVGFGVILCGGFCFFFSGRIYQAAASYFSALICELKGSRAWLKKEVRAIPPLWGGVLLAIVAVSAWIRISYLGVAIRYDESFTFINYASRNPLVTYILYDGGNNHVLHNLLVNVVTKVLGQDEAIIRIPAFMASVLSIPLIFILCRLLFGNYSAGLFAAALLGGSAYMIEYGINARGYSMICLFTLILLISTYAVIINHLSVTGWTTYVLSALCGMATNPAMFYPIAISVIWYLLSLDFVSRTLIFTKLRVLTLSLTIAILLTLLWYLPGLLLFGLQPFTDHGVGHESLLAWGSQYGELISDLFNKSNAFLNKWIVVVICLSFVIGLLRLPRLGLAMLIVPVLMSIQRIIPPSRAMIFVTLLYFIISAGGLAKVFQIMERISYRFSRPAYSVLALLLCIFPVMAIRAGGGPPNLDGTYGFPEGPQVVEFLKGKIGPRQPVLSFVPSDSPLIYYAVKEGLPYQYIYSTGLDFGNPGAIWLVTNDRSAKCTLERLMTDNGLDTLNYAAPQVEKSYGPVKVYSLKKIEDSPH